MNEENYYLLGDVGRILELKPHQVVYAITSGRVEEPTLRVGNKRVFTADDVNRIAAHFRVTPRWPGDDYEATSDLAPAKAQGLVLKRPFYVQTDDTKGFEVRDGDGEVACATADRGMALILAGLLESATAR